MVQTRIEEQQGHGAHRWLTAADTISIPGWVRFGASREVPARVELGRRHAPGGLGSTSIRGVRLFRCAPAVRGPARGPEKRVRPASSNVLYSVYMTSTMWLRPGLVEPWETSHPEGLGPVGDVNHCSQT